ncbi:titin isoform X2 [Aplysia californica]|uniref:PHD finger protein 10 n=1 Tax=Aplysia californica TaxID=6500 RepID=A0ABM0JDV4_APLCA|nr:titin isoform X2 [Aplysia californica]
MASPIENSGSTQRPVPMESQSITEESAPETASGILQEDVPVGSEPLPQTTQAGSTSEGCVNQPTAPTGEENASCLDHGTVSVSENQNPPESQSVTQIPEEPLCSQTVEQSSKEEAVVGDQPTSRAADEAWCKKDENVMVSGKETFSEESMEVDLLTDNDNENGVSGGETADGMGIRESIAESSVDAGNDKCSEDVAGYDEKASNVCESSSASNEATEFKFLKPSSFNLGENDNGKTPCIEPVEKVTVEKRSNAPIHVPEMVYDIDEETRMGLDQSSGDASAVESTFNYPLPPKQLFTGEDTKDSEASDTETKMSIISDTEDIRLRNTISIDDATKDSVASDSNTETPVPSKSSRRSSKEGSGADVIEDTDHSVSAEGLFEYQWPQDGGDWHLLQEQISEYLKVKSFKRKYPDLYRRTCDKEEKDFLREKGVVTETQSDLGLTALRSEEVYDLMMKDYNDKYREYVSVLQEKQKRVIREKHKEYCVQPKLDKSKIMAYSKKAAKSAAEYNSSMMREKRDERRAYFDLQTYVIHYPRNHCKTLPPEQTKRGAYPVSVIKGQFQENYRKYNAQELSCFPVKTCLKDPPKLVRYVRPPPLGIRMGASSVAQKPEPVPEAESEAPVSAEVQEDVLDGTNKNKENEVATASVEMEEPVTVTPVKVERKVKSSCKKKLAGVAKGHTSSPERPKKSKKSSKETPAPAEKSIHGLEKCRICKQRSTKEERKNDRLVKCAQCGKIGHMSCLDLTEELVAVIKTYPWQCMECKTCVECLDPYDEDKMMFCDRCDRGYHTFCIGLNALPTGQWECKNCEGAPKILNKSSSHKARKKPRAEAREIKPDVVGEKNPETKAEEGTTVVSETAEIKPEDVEMVDESQLDVKEVKTEDTATPSVSTAREDVKQAERSGKKRKNPGAAAQPKPAKTPRIQGERQSRRLKLKGEEGEDGEKKGKDKRFKKKKRLNKEPGEVSTDGKEGGEVTLAGGALEGAEDEGREIISEGVDESADFMVKDELEINDDEVPEKGESKGETPSSAVPTGSTTDKADLEAGGEGSVQVGSGVEVAETEVAAATIAESDKEPVQDKAPSVSNEQTSEDVATPHDTSSEIETVDLLPDEPEHDPGVGVEDEPKEVGKEESQKETEPKLPSPPPPPPASSSSPTGHAETSLDSSDEQPQKETQQISESSDTSTTCSSSQPPLVPPAPAPEEKSLAPLVQEESPPVCKNSSHQQQSSSEATMDTASAEQSSEDSQKKVNIVEEMPAQSSAPAQSDTQQDDGAPPTSEPTAEATSVNSEETTDNDSGVKESPMEVEENGDKQQGAPTDNAGNVDPGGEPKVTTDQ